MRAWIGSRRRSDALRFTRPCDAVRKTAISQKPQRGTPHRWLRDPQTADTLRTIDERCLAFKELPARSLVLSLS